MRRSVSKADDCHRSVPESRANRNNPDYFLFADNSPGMFRARPAWPQTIPIKGREVESFPRDRHERLEAGEGPPLSARRIGIAIRIQMLVQHTYISRSPVWDGALW